MIGSMALRGVTILFFILLSSSFILPYAGRPILKSDLATEVTEVEGETLYAGFLHDGSNSIHQRMLRVTTNDYGNYNPSPTFKKPPFKLIPN